MNAAVSSTGSVRVANERAVYDVLCHGDGLTAPELGATTGLSKPTVGIALAELEQLGLVEQVGRRRGSTGRAPRLYRLRAQAGGALAIDVGRLWVRGARVDLSGRVRTRTELQADGRSADALVDQILRLAADLDGRRPGLGASAHTVLGSPGVYDAATDVIRLAPNLPGWEAPSVLARLRRRCPGTWSSRTTSTWRPSPSSTTVPRRARTTAGRHLRLRLRRHRSGHGHRRAAVGCCAGPAARRGRSPTCPPTRPRRATSTRLEELTGLGLDRPRGPGRRDWRRRARRPSSTRPATGRRRPGRSWRREAERLGLALAAVVAVLDPPLIILGGGVGRNGDLLLGPVRADLERRLPLPPPEIRISQLGVDAPLQGALADGLARCRHTAFEAATSAAD